MNENCEKLKAWAPLFLRIGLGIIFLYHGISKVFGEGANLGSSWNPAGMPTVLQILVAWLSTFGFKYVANYDSITSAIACCQQM